MEGFLSIEQKGDDEFKKVESIANTELLTFVPPHCGRNHAYYLYCPLFSCIWYVRLYFIKGLVEVWINVQGQVIVIVGSKKKFAYTGPGL